LKLLTVGSIEHWSMSGHDAPADVLPASDDAEQDLLHMITADPNRTPNFILSANPDYFFLTSGKTPVPLCTLMQNAASCFAP
jgi:hypothetical protein